ncbi:hypothetical protein FSP39_011250 [Pinctada imbricata]|uniref:Uncharacterized protein n=1 Tax=Pinctada imbricata TaxID=66713 RepID=A0AA88YJC9_PINIB|nr:hypothetical protein FSP39_011250 [Pinctada imbricata]
MELLPVTSELDVNYRTFWQKSYRKDYFCNASTVAAAKTINAEGELKTVGGCKGRNLTSLPLQCTDYSEVDDWMSGTNSLEFECRGSFISLMYTGRQWPTLKNGGNHWSLFLNASLTKRSDTNKVNRSPVSVMQPIIRLLHGCKQNITIPVVDNDGDIIRCRWSSSSVVDECGGICTKMPGINLDEKACKLIYSTNIAEVGTYGLAIQVEDFTSQADTIPMSSVPVQFLIEVSNVVTSCDSIPTITDSNLSNENIIEIPSGSAYEERVVAEAEDESHSIVAIDIIGPEGMNKSALQKDDTVPEDLKWFVDVFWQPTDGQKGKHLFCYMAVNDIKQAIASPQTCKELQGEYNIDVLRLQILQHGGDMHILAGTTPTSATYIVVDSGLSTLEIVLIVIGLVIGVPGFIISCIAILFKTKKGGDLQQDPAAASTAKQQNTRCKSTKDEYSTRRKRDTRHVNIKHKRLHVNRLDQWATGADFGRPFVTQVANGVVNQDYMRTTLSLHQLPRGLEERTIVV